MIKIKLRAFAKKYLQETSKVLQKDFQSRCIPYLTRNNVANMYCVHCVKCY